MIVFDRKEKEIKVPEGLGNINLTVLDANLEDKTVEINEVETTILPSSGYNGMSSLQIDAQPVYDNGYNEGENIGYNSGYTAGDIDGYNRGYNEGEIGQKAKLSAITITENGTYSREDGYNEITVDVQPKISVFKYGIKFAGSTFSEMPDFYDFEGVTDMTSMFNGCSNLQSLPAINTSNVTDMYNTFRGCYSLQSLPAINTSNVTNMERTFSDCDSLQSLPAINTSNVENAGRMFYYCSSLQSIPALNAEKMNLNSYGMFGGTLNALTDFGGLIGLKSSSNNNYSFNCCPNLTYQSCINILNGLYDFTGNGETPNSNQGQLKVHQNFLTTVGDEISIGVLKGWIISA